MRAFLTATSDLTADLDRKLDAYLEQPTKITESGLTATTSVPRHDLLGAYTTRSGKARLLPDALSASMTGRVNRIYAAHASQGRREALLREHRALASKALSEQLSRPEKARLALVRWELDRLRDAEIGPSLDLLEQLATTQEQQAREIDRFLEGVEKIAKPARQHGGRNQPK